MSTRGISKGILLLTGVLLLYSLFIAVINRFSSMSVLFLVLAVANFAIMAAQHFCFIFYAEQEMLLVLLAVIITIKTDFGKIRIPKAKEILVLSVIACTVVFMAAQFVQSIQIYSEKHRPMFSSWNERFTEFSNNTADLFKDGSDNKNLYVIENSNYYEARYLYYKLHRYPFTGYFGIVFFSGNTGADGTFSECFTKFYDDYKNAPPKYIIKKTDDELTEQQIEAQKTILDDLENGTYKEIYKDSNYILYELKRATE